MKIQKMADGLSFRLEGSIDHAFQLIYEALEIAAASNDIYAPEFSALADKLLFESADWME